MRVLVLAEAVGDLGAGALGTVAARAWADHGHQVAVVPLAEAGGRLAGAVDDLLGAGSGIVVVAEPEPGSPSSARLGAAVAAALSSAPDQVWVDLASATASDAGVGLLRELAGMGEGHEVTQDVVVAAHARLGGSRLVGVVREGQLKAELTGLRGVASLAAAAARDAGRPVPGVPELLEQDALLGAVAVAVGLPSPPPGAGAEGGLGLAILALGGSLASGPGALAEVAELDRTVERADLLVVVAGALDFGDAGGEVVASARSWAELAAIPCVALCQTVRISSRELRQLGIEAAYGLPPDADPSERAFGDLAAKVASTWTWGSGNRDGRRDVSTDVH